jgi:ribosome-associated toxin RatA of RatAB toxin-antitoxin module
MQEKYNKKLLTMKMLKTQKWAMVKKKQVYGSFRAVSGRWQFQWL